jgi:hypothetical protein
MLHDAIVTLRNENSQLYSNYVELQSNFALAGDQVSNSDINILHIIIIEFFF